MSEIVEHPEYNRDTNPYPSFGKKYNGEPAVISLTSWKARINTVSKTLFSLIKQCPGFHIVLVLSKDEFPLMEKELPDNLMLFVENKLIELLWIKPNLKSFKKVLFTMDKYRDVPVISADDDCIYTCNYAQMLYDEWVKDKNKKCRIGLEKVTRFNINLLCGYGTLFSPKIFKDFDLGLLDLFVSKKLTEDDMLYAILSKKYNIIIKDLGYKQQKRKGKIIAFFHDTNCALSNTRFYDRRSDYYKLKVLLK